MTGADLLLNVLRDAGIDARVNVSISTGSCNNGLEVLPANGSRMVYVDEYEDRFLVTSGTIEDNRYFRMEEPDFVDRLIECVREHSNW